MSLFGYFQDLARRHRRKVLLSAGVVGVSWLVGFYVSHKVEEFQDKLKEENFAKEQVKRRFKQTQSDCYMTFLSLLPVLVEPIYDELDVEEITRELQSRRGRRAVSASASGKGGAQGRSEGLSTVLGSELSGDGKYGRSVSSRSQFMDKSKSELWNDLKVQSLTRFLTLLYSESLLILFLHLQLNILSRKQYFETAVRLAGTGVPEGVAAAGAAVGTAADEEEEEEALAEQAFLSFSWWLLNRGWLQFKDSIEDSVEDVFGEINPRQELSMEEFATLINTVQQKIFNKMQSKEKGEPSDIVDSLLPPDEMAFYLLQQTNDVDFLSRFNQNLQNVQNLDKLLAELKDYLENEQVPSIANLLVTVGISKTLDNISASAVKRDGGAGTSQDDIKGQRQNKVKLASLLASITKQSHQLTNGAFDNDVLYTLNNLQELDDLSAGVYSNFD